jgi:hypothetical protein
MSLESRQLHDGQQHNQQGDDCSRIWNQIKVEPV